VEARPFAAGNLLDELEQWNRVRADRLVAQGLAKYLSPDQNAWRFTPRGACLYAFAVYFTGLQKAQAQKERAKKKRPGG
jgi:hypothetical protein